VKSKLPVSFFSGITAIIVYLIFTLIAFLIYPGEYSPVSNWLSDLGNPQVNPSGSIFYNIGCIITGLVLIVFYIELSCWNTGDKKMRILLVIAQVTGVLSSISLILSAIFPLGETALIHAFWSKMIFVFLGFFLTFSATSLLKHSSFIRWFAYYAFLTALVNFVYGAFLYSVFVLEWISLEMFMIYAFMLAYNSRLLLKSNHL
jgi:hypothetical membrane protein